MKRIAKLRQKFPLIALLSLYAYLAFHAFSGSQGLMRWLNYNDQSAVLSSKLEDLQQKRAGLEAEVDALKADGLDLDVLDVKSREILYVSDPKEITIWLDQTP